MLLIVTIAIAIAIDNCKQWLPIFYIVPICIQACLASNCILIFKFEHPSPTIGIET